VGPREGLDAVENRKFLEHYWELKPGRQAHSLVATSTELSRLHIFCLQITKHKGCGIVTSEVFTARFSIACFTLGEKQTEDMNWIHFSFLYFLYSTAKAPINI
jgi:hypothetical protein